jgi:hypothetical protein
MQKKLKRLVGKVVPDRYTCNARLYPSLLVIAPAVIAIVGIAKPKLSWLHSFWIGLGTAGGLYWLSQLARDPGKALEARLWQAWGGAPSIAILRHRDSRIDPITKSRYHARLVELVTNTNAPTPESESTDLVAADVCYSAWSTFLRTATRDQKRFHLVFDELVSYGYRRNLLGLRPYGLASSVISCIGCGVFIGLAINRTHDVFAALWLALSMDILLLLFWFFRVSPGWVHTAAEHYAARLTEAVDDVHSSRSKSPIKAPAKPRKPRTIKKT